jgi:hypothetical protein
MATLVGLNHKYSRMGSDVECAICTLIPSDPVRFCSRDTCRRLVCRKCANGYLYSPAFLDGGRQCCWCRQTGACHVAEDRTALQLVKECRSKEAQLRASAARIMQFFIFDFCLAAPSPLAADRQDENQQKDQHHEQPLLEPLEPALLGDFIALLNGLGPCWSRWSCWSGRTTLGPSEDTDSAAAANGSGSDTDSAAPVGLDVVPSLAARVSLLRMLLTRRDGRTPQLATQLLASELGATLASAPGSGGSGEAGLLDSQLAVCYMSLQEELLAEGALRSFDASTSAARHLDAHLDPPLARVAKGVPAADVLRVLQQVAMVRRVLVLYAEMLCGEGEGEAKVVSELGARVDALLTEGKDSKAAPVLRCQRLFLLKNMERRRGVAFVRSSLHQVRL